MSNFSKYTNSMNQNTLSMLKVDLPNLCCCINAHFVTRTLPFIGLQSIPQAPDYIKGFCNLYGKSVMVIDLASYLGLSEAIHYSLNTPLVICSYANKSLGFIVENIHGIIKIEASKIQLTDDFQYNSPVFSGTVITEEGSAMVLNMERLFEIYMNPIKGS